MNSSKKHDVLMLAVVVFFVGVLVSSVGLSDVFGNDQAEAAPTALQQGVATIR